MHGFLWGKSLIIAFSYSDEAIKALIAKIGEFKVEELAKALQKYKYTKTHYALLHQLFSLATLKEAFAILIKYPPNHIKAFKEGGFQLFFGFNESIAKTFVTSLSNENICNILIKCCFDHGPIKTNVFELDISILASFLERLDLSTEDSAFAIKALQIVPNTLCFARPELLYQLLNEFKGKNNFEKFNIIMNAYQSCYPMASILGLIQYLRKECPFQELGKVVPFYNFFYASLTCYPEMTNYVYFHLLTAEEQKVIQENLNTLPEHVRQLIAS